MATSTINTKVKMDGEREYRAALAQINAGLKNLGAEMRSVEQDFTDNADSVEALTRKNDVLERTLLTQREKVEKLQEVVAAATKTYGEADKRTIDWKTSLINAETELKKMERSLSDGRDALEKASNATDELSGDMGELDQSTEKASTQISYAADYLSDMSDKTGSAQRETLGLGTVVDQLTNKLGFSLPNGIKNALDSIDTVDVKTAALVGSFAGVVAAIVKVEKKLASLTTEAGETAKELLVMSEVTGQTTDELQEFEYMSKFLGMSSDQLKDALKEITNKMQEARDGSAEVADAFHRLGVRVTDSRGELRDAGEVFYEVIDALGEMRNKTERDATAMDLLSESAQNLNPLINRGSKVLRAFAEEAHNTGYVMDQETLRSLNAVDNAYQHMLLSQEATKNQLAEEFAPYLTEFYQNFESVITDLADAATESGLIDLLGSLLDLASALAPVLSSLADVAASLKPVFETLAAAISTVADAMQKVNQFSGNFMGGGIANSLIGLTGLSSGGLGAIGTLGAAQNLKGLAMSHLGHNATGTDNFPGGVTWVGENGPELVYLPQGSQIRSNQESRAVSGGDVFYVTIDAKNVKSFNDVVRVADNKRRAARMGVR